MEGVVREVVTMGIGLAGLPPAVFAGYLLTLAMASLRYRVIATDGAPRSSLAVLIPAHNESLMIAACVASIRAQEYPAQLLRIVVVADNCTDHTAALARRAGAEVLERTQPDQPGKGRALRWAMDQLVQGPTPPDGVIVVDADSTVEAGFLQHLEAALRRGIRVAQADDFILSRASSPRSQLEAAAIRLRNDVRLAGRAVLGLPATLCGNGMMLARSVLETNPWNAFSAVEDAEYAMGLRVAGFRTSYIRGARVVAASTATDKGAYTQSLRWDGGRYDIARRWLPVMLTELIRRRRWDLFETVIDLTLPPLGALAIGTLAGTALAAIAVISGLAGPGALFTWALGMVAVPAYLLIGLRAAQAPPGTVRSLLTLAPGFLLLKLRVYLRLAGGGRGPEWVRTERPGEST